MLLDRFSARSLQLANHMLMAPMTRSRATPVHTLDALATYYGQRTTAGLIISEGTSPGPNGLGYPRIPGLFDAVQVIQEYTASATLAMEAGFDGVELHGAKGYTDYPTLAV